MIRDLVVRRAPRGLAVAAGGIGAAGLLGRGVDSPLLAGCGTGQPIRTLAALGLVSGALTVWGLTTSRARMAALAAIMVLLIGLAPAVGLGKSGAGGSWPSPMTGLVFIALGCSALLISLRVAPAISQVLSVGSGALAVFGLLRSLFRAAGDYPLANWSWVTLPAALGLWLLSVSLLLAQPGAFLPRLLGGAGADSVMARRLLPAAMLVPVGLGSVRMAGQELGLYETNLGLAGMITTGMVLIVSLIVVTARQLRRVDEAREHALRLLADAQDIGGLASWVYSPSTGRLECSDQLYRMCGMSRADLQPTLPAFLALIRDSDRGEFSSRLLAVSAENPAFQLELGMSCSGGIGHEMLVRARAERAEGGEIARVIGTLLDVTDRRRNERALAERELRLATTLHSIGDAVIATDPNGCVERMNPVAEQLTGWRLEEAKGRRLMEIFKIINERTRAPVENPVDRVLREGRVVGLANHTAVVRRDGTERPISDSAAPIRDESGAVLGTVMVFRDITEERLADEERERLRARLTVADRMASLGSMAAGVAHEINNPLAFILANLSALERYIDDLEARWAAAHRESQRAASASLGEVREIVSDCREGSERVRRIVKDLLTFARGHEDESGVVDVQSVALFSLRMADAQLRLRARVVKDLRDVPPVAGGQARIGQVILNLLVNAGQAVPEGAPDRHQIRLATSLEPEGKRVVIEVCDTGAGIAPEHLPRLFDPFFTTKPIGSGTGLGLSVCHGIVTELGGEITVSTELGTGTTFRVFLPVALNGPAAPAITPHIPARRGRILVIDDEPQMGKSLARLLQPDHDVAVETQSRVALDRLIAGEHFDLVLCDLMMPELSGVDLYDRLSEARPAILDRFIFVSGGVFTSKAETFLSEKKVRCLAKPIEPKALFDTLRSLLGTHG